MATRIRSKDVDVRIALCDFLFAHGYRKEQVRHEVTLNTSSGGGRTDVVVPCHDGLLMAIEPKSAKDTLTRLERQNDASKLAFDRVTCAH